MYKYRLTEMAKITQDVKDVMIDLINKNKDLSNKELRQIIKSDETIKRLLNGDPLHDNQLNQLIDKNRGVTPPKPTPSTKPTSPSSTTPPIKTSPTQSKVSSADSSKDEMKRITTLPPIKTGENIVISDIPFIDTLTFTPVIIDYKGLHPNPLYTDKSKTIQYYYEKSSPNRKSKDKLGLAVRKFFDRNPEELTDENLSLPLGQFLLKMKNQGNQDYKLLVHEYGDEEDYVKFNVNKLTKERGLYIWVIDNVPTYIGIAASPNGLANRINNEYGSITSYKCTIDGQTQTCRSNSKLRDEFGANKSVALYICPVDVNSYLKNQDFLKTMNDMGFKGTRNEKNALEIFEKSIINKGNFKDGGWNRRLEETKLYNRWKKLAGII